MSSSTATSPQLFKIARDITDIVPAELDVKSKSERGYDLIEKTPVTAEKACDPELNAGISTGRAFTLIGRACLRHLIANVPATKNRNSEALHQMRVALRRLRAAISSFSDVVSDDRINTIKTELRWLAQEFGPARDLDTLLIEVIKPLRKQHANEPGLLSISRMFARQRLKGYRRAQEAVHSARFRMLVLDTAEWVEAGPWSTLEDPLVRARREMPIEISCCGAAFATSQEDQATGREDWRPESGTTAQTAHSSQKSAVRSRILFQRV